MPLNQDKQSERYTLSRDRDQGVPPAVPIEMTDEEEKVAHNTWQHFRQFRDNRDRSFAIMDYQETFRILGRINGTIYNLCISTK